jgi:hypothetical protein
MNNGRFCTLVLGEDGTIYRPLVRGGYQPSYGEFLQGYDERRVWIPGRVAEINFSGPPTGKRKRATHPEDRLVRGPIRIARHIIPPKKIREHVKVHTYESLYQLFPRITIDWQKGFYPDEPELERSAGYLRVHDIEIVKEGAPGHKKTKAIMTVWQTRQRIYVPIKDPALLARIESGDLKIGDSVDGSVLFLGLANSMPYRGEEMRAYIQLLHVLP